MSKYEPLISMGFYTIQDTRFYLYAVYQKILKDCLDYLYSLNLSDEEKQEQEKQKKLLEKRIYFDVYKELQSLNPTQRNLLQHIAISENVKHLTKILRTNNYPKQRVSELSAYFKDLGLLNKGGYDEIKELLRKHPEWFNPNVTEVTQSN